MKRFISGLLLVILGVGMMSFGFSGLLRTPQTQPMSDAQVIERAKVLGMIDLKEYLQEIND